MTAPAGACAGCGRSDIRLRGRADDGGRLCSNCCAIRRSGTCTHCGEHARINGRDQDGQPLCQRCRQRIVRHEHDTGALERIIAAVAAADPTLDREVIGAVLASVAEHARSLRRIARHLDAHADVFTVGPTDQRSLRRFVEALIAAGAQLSVIHPACVCCGRCQPPDTRHPSGWLCATCANQSRSARCVDCDAIRLVTERDAGGRPRCARCINRTRRRQRLEPINTAISERLDGIDIDPTVIAEVLDEVAYPVPTRQRLLDALEHEPALTAPARRSHLTRRLIATLNNNGANLPTRARPGVPPDYRCPACDRPTLRQNKIRCNTCTPQSPTRARVRRGTCAQCTRTAVPVDDHDRCGTCRRWASYQCATCITTRGLTIDPVGVRRCHPCILADELDELCGPNPPEWLIAIRGALAASKTTAATRHWFRHTTGGKLLAGLAVGTAPLTHEHLDQHPTRSVAHLRGLLIAAGALEPDDRWLSRLEAQLADTISATDDSGDRRVLASWLRWKAVARLRRRVERGQTSIHSAPNLRRQVAHIAGFLADLHAQQRSLTDCCQADVDAWFAQPNKTAILVRPFLHWAQQHRHLPSQLELPPGRQPGTRTAVDIEHRWQLARRLISDTGIAPDDRVAGALVVLYAQPLTRIVGLTTSHVHHFADGRTTIDLTGHHIELPDPLANLARQLPHRRLAGTVDQLPTNRLFPARRADRHITTTALGNRLRRLGIEPRRTRLAALTQLASEIPPAILANAIGVSARTATQWVTTSGGDYAAYSATHQWPCSP